MHAAFTLSPIFQSLAMNISTITNHKCYLPTPHADKFRYPNSQAIRYKPTSPNANLHHSFRLPENTNNIWTVVMLSAHEIYAFVTNKPCSQHSINSGACSNTHTHTGIRTEEQTTEISWIFDYYHYKDRGTQNMSISKKISQEIVSSTLKVPD